MKLTAMAAGYDPMRKPTADHVQHQAGAGEITISCYENDVPSFVEAEMDRLYGSAFSSLAQFRVYGDGTDTSTYIVRQGGKTITVYLFQHMKGIVRVINEVIRVSQDDALRFSTYVFETIASAKLVSFKAVQTDLRRLPFPFQRFNHLEDIVISLPETAEQYHASLGKNTRRNVKRYTKKLMDAFPDFSYGVSVKDETDGNTIREIIGLNRARMADKNKIAAIDEEETQRIIAMVKECGLVGVARINGRICAGAISFRSGANYFLSVIAHDPAYDDYWLGILCCYLTICECIARGGREFHFLWGQYEYKYTLMGVQRNLDNIAVYRSRVQMLLNGRHALKIMAGGYMRRARVWLHGLKRRDGVAARLALAAMNKVRNFRR